MPNAPSSTPTKASSARRPRAYLAGPEVFLKEALAIATTKKRLCARHGLEGVFPLDAQVARAGKSSAQRARAIGAANEALIRSCDIVIANCSPFRGVSMDAGTAYEVGYACALGKPVVGYTNVTASYRDRADRYRRLGDPMQADMAGSLIEDFGLAENLMIATAAFGRDLVRTRVRRGQELVDLRGFARSVQIAKQAIAAQRRSARLPIAQSTYARGGQRRKPA
jgi:nucleoside 2-deoxyribosyltransferase